MVLNFLPIPQHNLDGRIADGMQHFRQQKLFRSKDHIAKNPVLFFCWRRAIDSAAY